MDENELSKKQLLVISNYLSAPTIDEACERSNISRATFYNWLKDENFKKLLDRKRQELITHALDRLKASVSKAIDVLQELMKANNDNVKRLAARDVLQFSLKAIEIFTLQERLEKIEKIVEGKYSHSRCN